MTTPHIPVLMNEVVDALADVELVVDGPSLTLLVDGETDDGGSVLARERHHAVES